MIERQLSVKLDSLRGFAAIYIVAHHYFKNTLMEVTGGGINRCIINAILGCGQEVVIFFLLLSGFLSYVSYSENPQISVSSFLRKKALRIYPLYLICLVFSLAVQYYTKGSCSDIKTILGNVLMLQDAGEKPGIWFSCAGGNYAIWYLSFQWWDYVIFILLSKCFRSYNVRLAASFGLCVLGMVSYWLYPNHISNILWYYWIFEMGCYLGRCYMSKRNIGLITMVSNLLIIAIWILIAFPADRYGIGAHPILECRHFADVFIGLCFISIYQKFNFGKLSIFKPFKVFSKISYSIYLFHVPCMLLFRFILHSSLLASIMAVPVVLLLAFVLEKYLEPKIVKLFK